MKSQQPLTAPMVDQFMQMVLCEKRKTKFAVKKYKDLKNANDDKKSMPATQQAITVTHQKPVLKEMQNHQLKLHQKE